MLREPKKILIFAKPAVGDILLATPLMHGIRTTEPEAIIDVMCYPGQEGILEGNPDIDNIVLIDQKPSIRDLLVLGKRLFRKYDIAITNGADDRVHLYLLVFGRKRLSVTTKESAAWKHWITHASVVEGPDTMHALLRNNRLGNLLGIESNYRVVVPSCASVDRVTGALATVFDSPTPYAVLHADARLPYKRWTTAGWCDVIKYLGSRGLRTFITGGPSVAEREYISEILNVAPDSARSLAGKLSFAEVAELIRSCKIYIGVDTVTSHLAAAINVPTIALFGPESPHRWGPWPADFAEDHSPWLAKGTQHRNNVLIIQGDKSCARCAPGECELRHNRGSGCPLMTGITSHQVTEGIREFLD